MDREQFGLWAKDLRVDAGFSQQKLADLLHIKHSQQIAGIEGGTCLLPKKCYRQFIKLFSLDPKRFIKILLKLEEQDLKSIIFDRKLEKVGKK